MKREPVTTDPGEKLLRQGPPDAALSARAGATTTRGTPQTAAAWDADRAGRDEQGRGQPDEDNSTKELAVAALAWMRDALPWTTSKPANAAREVEATPADEMVLPADMTADETRAFAAGGAHPAGQADPATGQRTVSLSMPSDSGPDRRGAADPAGENSLRALINFGRDVVSHPLTWLVVLLIGIAHIVLSLAGRGK